jgi:hypothetical protein
VASDAEAVARWSVPGLLRHGFPRQRLAHQRFLSPQEGGEGFDSRDRSVTKTQPKGWVFASATGSSPFDALFEEAKGQWEERYERRFGFWRGFVDEQVQRCLGCGLFENGFARVRCSECHADYLLAFSRKMRKVYPSIVRGEAGDGDASTRGGGALHGALLVHLNSTNGDIRQQDTTLRGDPGRQ